MATKTTSKAKSTTAKATSAGRRKSTTAKAGATASAAAKPIEPVSAPAPASETKAAPEANAEALRRPDLIQAVADRVSLKRSEAKMVFDVVLDEIGKALDANEEVIVPPLGKLMVKKRLDKPNGQMLTMKLKRAQADPTVGDVAPLAKADEES